jgi:ribonuclease R
VQVVLDRILAQERRLQFSVVEEGIPLTGKPAGNAPRKPKKSKRASDAQSAPKGKKKFHRKGRRR